MSKVGQVKEIYEMNGAGRSIWGIANEMSIALNTNRRNLNTPHWMRSSVNSFPKQIHTTPRGDCCLGDKDHLPSLALIRDFRRQPRQSPPRPALRASCPWATTAASLSKR